MMNCKEVLSLLPRTLSGESEPMAALEIEDHLKDCRLCSIVYESARETVERMSGDSAEGRASSGRGKANLVCELPAHAYQAGGEK